MKQKYAILREEGTGQLIIREFAELDKEILSLLCEAKYEKEIIESAIRKGKTELIFVLRTMNLYPPATYIDQIADKVIEIFSSENLSSDELFFDDILFLSKNPEPPEELDESDDEPSGDLDELLDDDLEDAFDESDSLNSINSPLKIADEDSLDIEDDL